MAVLEMKEIFYAYEKGRQVLSNVNIQFDAGKMYAILGPSGSGKTTLLSLIGGLDTPQKGEILFEGGNISQCGLAAHRRNHVSLIFQSYNLIDYMTPIENVALTAKKDVLPMLLRLGLTAEEAKRNVMKLSGGQQQRVAIGRALITKPKLILADEPTGNLDRKNSREVMELLRKASGQYQQTILMITHNPNLITSVDRVMQVADGILSDLGGNVNEKLS